MWSAFARYGGLIAARLARPGSREPAVALGIGCALLSFTLFSTMDTLIKWLSAGYPVHELLFLNALFSLVPVSVMILWSGGWGQLRTRRPLTHLLRGASGMTAAFCAFTAFSQVPLADAYAILFTTPLLITALSALMLGETVRWRRWSAILVGFSGVLIMLQPGTGAFGPGAAAALAAALASALSITLVRKLSATETTASIAFYTNAVVIVAMASLLPFDFMVPSLADLGLNAAAGLAGGTAVLLLIAGHRRAPAALVAPFQYSQMIWGVLFGFLVWREVPGPAVVVGATIVVASGLFILYREVRLASAPAETPAPSAAAEVV